MASSGVVIHFAVGNFGERYPEISVFSATAKIKTNPLSLNPYLQATV
jgi:hypothetical protein